LELYGLLEIGVEGEVDDLDNIILMNYILPTMFHELAIS
jgi:hypothetical protein